MKPITIVFCDDNSPQDKTMAYEMMKEVTRNFHVCAATEYIYHPETHNQVLIMPGVGQRARKKIHEIYPVAEDFKWSNLKTSTDDGTSVSRRTVSTRPRAK